MNLSLLGASMFALSASSFLIAETIRCKRGKRYRKKVVVLFSILALLSLIDIYRSVLGDNRALSVIWDWLSFYFVVGFGAFFYRENKEKCRDDRTD